jgi:tetratricopeptide (TPR) repeat protein
MDIALRINPRYADYYRVRGKARAGLKQFDEALADYDFILKEFAHFPLVPTWKQERAAIEAARDR